MSARRLYDPATMRPVLIPPDGRDDPRTAVPLRGYSLRQIEARMDLVPEERRAQLAAQQRAYRARKRGEA